MKFKVFSKIRFFFLIYSVMIFSACHDSDKIEPEYGERTVLIYMAADNNLNKDGETNIKSILKGMEQTAGRLVIYIDPRYDVPLYKLVYNDSVITAAHWDWSTFRIQGAAQDRMVREVLYNVPPLWHLDDVEWEKYKTAIADHYSVWSDFSRQAVLLEMTDFEYVTPEGSVQKTVYGSELSAVANFSDSIYQYEDIEIPAHSVLIINGMENKIYTPSAD